MPVSRRLPLSKPAAAAHAAPAAGLPKGLQATNLVASAAHAAAAIGFGALFARQAASRRQVTLTKTTVDAHGQPLDACNNVNFPAAAVASGAPLDIAPLVVGFFGVTAAAHLAYGLDLGGVYSREINGRGWNPLRWLEYGVSASMMSVIIGAADGTRDRVSLGAAALATAAMQSQGYVVERALRQGDRSRWAAAGGKLADMPPVDGATVGASTLCGWLLFVLLWYMLLANFSNVTADARKAGAPVPSWLGWIAGSQALFFASFGGVQVAQIAAWRRAESDAKAGRPVKVKDFAAYERTYVALSFASKLSLASILAYGMFQRSNAIGCN